jgi:dihydrodipicolinate synthase/N-acetylneuraminate lyase
MKAKVSSLKAKLSNGVTPAMATPLKSDSYRVNTAVIPQLVDFLLNKGVKGFFVGGTTGEGIMLDSGERKKLHEATLATVNGRVPVLLHIGAQRCDTAVDLARHAASIQADAVAAVTPYFYSMHDDALAAYYQAIAEAVPDMPLFGYDIPQMAVNGISPVLAARLCESIPSMAGLKSSNPSVQAMRRLLDAVPDDRIVLAGNESAALGMLALGADGLISGLSTAVPEPFVAMTQAFADGEIGEARKQQRLINHLLSNIPAGERLGAIKSVLTGRGILAGTTVPTLQQSTNAAVWPAMRAILEQ